MCKIYSRYEKEAVATGGGIFRRTEVLFSKLENESPSLVTYSVVIKTSTNFRSNNGILYYIALIHCGCVNLEIADRMLSMLPVLVRRCIQVVLDLILPCSGYELKVPAVRIPFNSERKINMVVTNY